MAYHWTPQPPGAAAETLNRTFADQALAEEWLAASYLELVDEGVQAVSLHEEDRLVYGPMSLEP